MNRSLVFLTILGLLSFVVSCGDTHHARPRSSAVSNGTNSPQAENSAQNDNQNQPSSAALPTPNEEELFVTGSKNKMLVPYALPKPLEDHLETTKKKPTNEPIFNLEKPYLKIDVDNATMTFTGVVTVKGAADESVELRCTFNRDDVPWVCNNMFPTDAKIAKQRRLQATVNCLDNYRCQELGFDFYAVIGGKKYVRHFETQPVRVREASSGDIDDFVEGVQGQPLTPAPEKIRKDQSRIENQKPSVKQYSDRIAPLEDTKPDKPPSPDQLPDASPVVDSSGKGDLVDNNVDPTQSQVDDTEGEGTEPDSQPDLTDNQIEDSLKDDSGGGLEFNDPIASPEPDQKSDFSIPGVSTIAPKSLGKNVRNQAHRLHYNGNLLNANTLPRQSSTGYLVRSADDLNGVPQRNFATDIMVEMIQGMAAKTKSQFPGRPPFVIANISKKLGGRLCRGNRCHASHQTGLDADIGFPAKTKKLDLFDATRAPQDMDVERFYFMAKSLVCAKGDPVIAMFIDQGLKRKVCAFAKQSGDDLRDSKNCGYKALRHMIHWPGHKNHFHMRLRCPGNAGCQNANVVPKFSGTGCN